MSTRKTTAKSRELDEHLDVIKRVKPTLSEEIKCDAAVGSGDSASSALSHPVETWLTEGSLMFWQSKDCVPKGKIASFDFDGCLAKTSLFKHGPDAWSILYPSIPEKLRKLHDDGYRFGLFLPLHSLN